MTPRIGAIFAQAKSGTDPDVIRRFAVEVEGAGYEHLLAYDHILGASPERLGPGPFGNFPSAPYTSEHIFHEILTLFSHLAAVTTTLELVTSVVVLPQRQAPLVAKQVATIDLLSGGRLRLAVGTGWNAAEYEGMGVDFGERTARLEEQIEVMRRLWTEPLVTFEGRFHRLNRVGLTPLPSRPIPVMLGTGGSDAVLRRVVRVADGWMPLLMPGLDPIPFTDALARLRQLCDEAGRDPDTLPVFGRVMLGPGWQDALAAAVEAGCADISIGAGRDGGDTLDEHLDKLLVARAEIDQLVG
jgi:probable F420-dependent oxidoreductase